jgi:2-succinyl-6-hydroxy-2,4-cyclohexadiene-1-carboxylate synthase
MDRVPRRRIVLAHGFTQNGRCWGRFGELLALRHELVTPDAPGHGACDPAHDTADLDAAGRLLARAGGPAVYVGYSMGGRVALHTALDPETAPLVEALVLIGATPGLEDEAERAARRAADEALADTLQADTLQADTLLADPLLAGGPDPLEGNVLEAFLRRWLALPLFAGLPPEDAMLPERLTNRPEGLAASLRHCGTGTQRPRWSELGRITCPVLVLAGERDEKFSAIGRRMATAIGSSARFEQVPGAGHAAHAERPEIVSALIEAFVGTRPA